MKKINNNLVVIIALLLYMLFPGISVYANDGVYFTSGNFLVPVKETDISVKKEVLTITLCSDGYADVDVDYTLYNNSNVTKNVTMAFEASAPYNAGEPLNRKGVHPDIEQFSVVMNGTALGHRNALVAIQYRAGNHEVDFSPLDMSQWKGPGEGVDDLIPVDGVIYNQALDSLCSFAYAYYFDAEFHPGENKVHHTYRYKMSYHVGVQFDVPYWLTPITRWANGKADDFTLRIKNGEGMYSDILMNDSVLRGCEFNVIGGMPVYHIKDEYRGSCIYATFGEQTVLEWHGKDFAPKEDIRIESGDAINPVKPQYSIDGKVVIDEDSTVYRYLADTEDGYFISVQDFDIVPREGSRIENYSAENGQGVVYLNNETKAANVRKAPTKKSKVVCVIKKDGDLLEAYPCLGYVKEKLQDGSYKFWFKINVDGKVGYVSRSLMCWDTICTF